MSTFLKVLNEDHPCAFCSYRGNKRINLKCHLNSRHSPQTAAPILLSNDPILTNARFQCSTCRSYLTSFWLCPIIPSRATVCSGLVLSRLLHVRGPLELLANFGLFLGSSPISASFLEQKCLHSN